MAKRKSNKKNKVTWESSNEHYKAFSNGFLPTKEYWSKQRQQESERKQQEQQSQRLTKYWKEDSYDSNGQNISWQKYRQKQIIDSNGGITGGGLDALKKENEKELDRFRQRQNNIISNNTKKWRDMSQNATYAGAPELAYAGKMIRDTPVSKEQEEKYGQNAREMKYNDFLDRMIALGKNQNKNTTQQGRAGRVGPYASEEEILARYNKAYREKIGSQLGTEKDLTPEEEYAQLSDSEKSGWLRGPQGNAVKDLLSSSRVKQHINTHPYDLKAAQAEMEKYESATKAAVEKVDAMHNDIYQQVADTFSQKPFHAMGDVFDFVNGLDKQNEQTILDNKHYNGKILENALNTLSGLESTEKERRQFVLDRAEDFLKNSIDLDMPDYVDDPDAMRRALYDNIMPDTYDERTANMTTENKAELDRLLDNVLQRASTEQNYVPEEYEKEFQKYLNEPEMLEAEKYARYYKDRYDEAEAEVKFIEKYQHLMNNYYKPQAPNFIPENDKGGFSYKTQAEIERGIQTDDVHRIYSFINGGKEWQSWAAGNKDPRITNEYNYAGLMNDAEIAQFNDFYNRGEYESASQFLQALNDIGALSKRYSDYEKISIQETARMLPILSSVAAQGMMMTDTFVSLPREIAGLLGDKSVKDPNSGWYTGSRANETIQNEIAGMLGDTGGKIYLQGMQSVRNVINGLLTKGFGFTGGMQQVGSLALFASQIYQESVYKNLKETNDFDKARGLAALDAVMETVEELLPYETMLSGAGRNPVLNFFLNGLSEMGEEATGATLGERIRGAISGRDSLQKRSDEIYVNGGYYGKDGQWVELDKTDKQKAINEADMQAIREWRKDVEESMAGGFFGGTLGGTYGLIAEETNKYSTGRRINSENNTEEGKTGAERIIELGAGMDRNTESYKLAKKLQDLTAQNKKPNNFQLGKLAQNIYAETSEQIAPIAQGTVAREARHQLMDQGMDYAKAEEAGNAIAKYLTEGSKSLTAEERTALAQNDKTVKLLESFISDPLQSMSLMARQMEDMQPQQSIRQQVAELASGKGRQRYSASVEDVAAAVQNAKAATANEIRQASGRSTGAANEIIHDGVIGSISAIRNGEAVITVNGEEQNVDLIDIKAVNQTAAAVITFAQKNKGLITDDYATRVLQGIGKNSKVDAGKYLDDAMKIRLAALSLNTQPKTTGIDSQTAKELYDAAKAEFDAAEQERISKAMPSAKPGEGSATIDGAEYGTDEFQQKIKGLGLSKQTRNQVGALSEISVRAGFRVNYINDTAHTDVYGFYDQNTGTITINLAGENEAGVSHHLLVTAGHEMTHWLEQNSKEGYAQLRQFIIGRMRARGENIEQRLVDTINNFNAVMGEKTEGLDLNGAMAEIVANACDQVLSSQAVADELAKVNPSLYNKVKSFVKDFVARVREAVGGMKRSVSHESGLLLNDVEEIAKIWLGARDEALVNENTGATDTDEKLQYSFKTMKEMTWDQQVNRILSKKASWDDMLVTNDTAKLQNIGLNKPLVIRQSVLTKGMKIKVEGKSASAHDLTRTNILNLQDAILNPVARIEKGTTQIIVTDLQDVDHKNIVLIANPRMDFAKGGVYDTTTVGGRGSISTLFGKFDKETGKFLPDKSAKIYRYKENANDILSQSPRQFGTGADVFDAIEMLSQDTSDVKQFSTRQQKNADTTNWKNYFMRDGQVIMRDADRNETVLTGLDREYVEAYNKGDFGRMEEILADKIRENGAIPFKAPNRYNDKDHSFIAKKIKEGDMQSVQRAAQEMAEFVPENAALIPMPNHFGQVNEDTDTMILAQEIAKITGRPVISALAGAERISRYEDKKRPKSQQMKAEDLGFRQVKDIPEGTVPYFIDNVIASGLTAKAAHQAMGNNGVTLAYAKSTQSATDNLLKRANVTFYDQPGGKKYGNWLIPLSERIDLSKGGYEGTKFSTKQRDQEYQKAVDSKDVEQQKRLVYEAADQAMPDTKARYGDGELVPVYHGTHSEFNVFDTSVSGGSHGTAEGYGIYLTDRKEISDKYGERVIAGYLNVKRLADYNRVTIKKNELVNLIKATCEKEAKRIVEDDPDYSLSDALKDTWISNYVYTPEYKTINDAYAAVADIILKQESSDMSIIQEVMAGNAIRDYEAAMDFYHDILTPVTRFDGFWTEWKNSDDEVMGNIFVVFDSSQIKLSDPMTFDNNGDLIPLSERFNADSKDIRYSISEKNKDGVQQLKDADGNELAAILPGDTISASQYSLRSWVDDNERGKVIKVLKKLGYTKEQIEKWIGDLNSIANIIASDRTMYDFVADRSKTFLKDNGDVYKKTIDASTMCKKTRLYNGTFNLVQHMLPNTILMPEDLIDLFNLMKDYNKETPCGFCYVQSRRRHLGPYTEEWLQEYKGDYIPTVDEVTTSDGLEKLKTEHPQAYTDFVAAMNKKGVNNPKLVQQRTDYRGEIRKMRKSTIDYLKKIGGLRIQSFSDFEVVHMLDMMQAVMDMKAVGLTAQAYTKVPEFAWIFGKTGIKINLSLVGRGTGLDANGNLVFDNEEGIDFNEAMKLRDAYSKNVGTILVGINDDHIIAAMGDSRIDFIIPFHKSGWSDKELKHMRGLDKYMDYTASQNEYNIKTDENGNTYTEKAESNIDPLSYWKFNLDGQRNAEIYLDLCAKQKIIPKFSQFLVDNGDGTYSLPQGNDQRSTNIREGYWKTLIDFKMYDNNGKGSRQTLVEPNFNMEKANEILSQYDGSHRELPEARDVAEEYVRRYKKEHPLDDVRTQYSIAQGDMNVNRWMLGLSPDMLYTEQEKNLLKQYKGLRMDLDIQNHAIEEYSKQLRKLEAKQNPSAYDREEMRKLRILIENREKRREKFQDEMIRVTSSEGYAGMMYRSQNLMNALVNNRTADEVRSTVDAISKELERVKAEMAERDEKLKEMANEEGVAVARTYFAKANIKQVASELKKNLNSKMKTDDIVSMLAVAALKMRNGENVTEDVVDLATLLVSRQKSDFDSYVLSELRGRTITLSEAQMKEIRGTHRTLRDIQKELAGTGIRVKTGKGNTLDKVWDELCDRLPMLNRDINDLDMMDDLLRVVRSEMNIARESQYGSMEQVSGMVLESVLGLVDKAENIDSTTKEMIDYIRGLAGEAKEQSQLIQNLTAAVDRLKERTAQARGAVSVLDRDVRKAIDYFNTLTEQSEAAIWRSERAKLIAQMKEEKTEALLAEQDKWKERIAKDKAFRESVQNNMAIRKKIHTVADRLGTRLFAETDEKNIPEEAKPLVRQIIRMLTNHDAVYRKITMYDKKKLMDIDQRLLKMTAANGGFDPDTDLDWLVIKTPDPADSDYSMRDKVIQDLVDIESGLMEYRNAKGSREITQRDINAALTKIQEAISEIYNVIQRRSQAFISGKRYELKELAEQMESEMAGSKFKGEKTSRIGRAVDMAERGIGYGNLTPEYFFKNLKNSVMSLLHKGFHDAENRAGLEAKNAMETVRRIAQETGFNTWNGQEIHKVKVKNGQDVEMTTEQIMALYATWLRESNQLRPEDTAHLLHGGFVISPNTKGTGAMGRVKNNQRPIRMNKETLAMLGSYLTTEQRQYVEDIMAYMSGELAEIGNETSMQTWGIKKFTEQYYFPIKAWGGVLNKSSDAGISSKNDNRAMRQSFTKRVRANASNAIEIGDFTPTAMKHIVGMITFNTVGPAVENMNKVLNQQLQYGSIAYDEEGNILDDDTYKRNVRAAFQDAYGEKALKYLERFMSDVNGGMTQQIDKSFKERLLSVFRKNAVAGSLSVTLQQPLSYIRAAMMINPKYLAGALSPQYWKGSYKEMLEHSGVAVIKDMGRFDMNQGQSMIDYISPEEEGRYEKVTKALTILPELADRMTWTRMWSAVKMEQHALHPEMDTSSDEFLDLVGERFNEVMRKTQVYDSMMVKSQNMRSKNYAIKAMTSFMAEPTLSLNVLADAVRNVGEKGGKTVLAKAGATFALSAICQAIIKGLMGSGRSPDKKKTMAENFLNKFQASLIGEIDPMNLIPGFNDLVELLKTGELKDDAMGVIGKFKTIWETSNDALQGKGKGTWRDIEDTAGQIAQLFTNIPVKNLMRDTRAMYNWISQEPYAKRENSAPVIKYQAEANRFKGDNLFGVINTWLGDAGFSDKYAAYYDRIYQAEKAGDKKTAEELKEYITLTSKIENPEKAIESALRKKAKEDDDLTAEQKYNMQKEYGLEKGGSFILEEYKKGNLSRKDAERLYRKENPKATDKTVLSAFDKIDYEKAGKLKKGENYSNYMPLKDAMDKNSAAEIKKAVKRMTDNGYTAKNITDNLTNLYKQEYLDAQPASQTRIRILNAIEIVYKALGLSAEDAKKKVNGWKPAKSKKD